jgi:hypothetical protein
VSVRNDHRPHGPLTAHATKPALNGYLLTVACPCGVVFKRWVTPVDVELDLLRAARLTDPPQPLTNGQPKSSLDPRF